MPTNPIVRLAETVDRRLKQAGDTSPGVRRLMKLIEVIHFTSLKTEEGKQLQLRIALVNPAKSDPERPLLIRPDRWTITRLEKRIPLTIPSLIKLSKAADPWSSTLAVFYDSKNEFFVWGMIDQTVHFNTMLVRETEFGGYLPPGTFQVAAAGTADLSVYHGFDFVARLQQDQLLTRQSDVFWSGPVIESEEAIQASLMEVINALARNTIDLKRAELIIRALHIAVKNAHRVRFQVRSEDMVNEVPDYPTPTAPVKPAPATVVEPAGPCKERIEAGKPVARVPHPEPEVRRPRSDARSPTPV